MAKQFCYRLWTILGGWVARADFREITIDDLPRIPVDPSGTWYGPFTVNRNGVILRATGDTPPSAGSSSSVFTHAVDAPNTGGAETDLYTDTLPAGLLAADGDVLQIDYLLELGAGVGATVKFYFDDLMTPVWNSSSISTVSSITLAISLRFIRVDATTVRQSFSFTGGFDPKVNIPTWTKDITVTLSGTVDVKITGTATSDGDIVASSAYATLLS